MRRLAVCLLFACNGVVLDTGETTDSDTGSSGEPTDGATKWARWDRQPERQFRGQVFTGGRSLAADPCVLHGDDYRMYYTCSAGAEVGGLCGVSSPDGFTWTPLPSIAPAIDGLIARARPGIAWDENMGTCAVHRDGDGVALHYAGYPQVDANGVRGPAALGVLASPDGVQFTRESDTPELTATPGSRDGDDIFGPAVIADGDALELVYVGYCAEGYHDGLPCDEPAVQLLGATRSAAGVWSKRSEPVFAPREEPGWLRHGVADPDLLRGPDGRYYLFLTGGLGDDEPRVTGLAVGPTAFGPWTLDPEPIVEGVPGSFDACGAFAPSVVLDGDRARMWYLGVDDCDGACQSCNHTQCGCDPRLSIGYAEASWPLYDE